VTSYSGTDNLEVMADAVNYNRFLDSLLLRHLPAQSLVLDFGAGIGTFARRLAAEGLQIQCVEPDAGQAAVLRSSGFRCEASVLDFEPASFDAVYSLNVLEHIDDDATTARAILSRLKPRGRFIVYVPAFQFLFSGMDRKVGHLRRYDRRQLVNLLSTAGFEVAGSRYADSLGMIATLAYKVVGPKDGSIDRRSLVAYDRYAFPLSLKLDAVLGPVAGKNVWAIGLRPG
jgi:SAM-dependent methyltransferase